MENALIIESPQNPRVKAAVKLRKSNVRRQTGETLVEGYREILRASDSGWRFKELYCCPELYLDLEADKLVSKIRSSGVTVYLCSETAFRKMSYRDTSDGLMALSPLVGKKLDELKLPDNPLLLIAEDLEKPGNLGTILRTADATGVDAVIACDHKTDINNPNVIRASIGTLFFMPVAEASTEETLLWLKKRGIQSLAAVPGATQEYTDIDMKNGTAIIVGAEDEGLSQTWIEGADHKASIPMLGRNDSLNVSTAAAILLYEAVRQRRKTP
ncbi:TrmH family RNA methyltransferase [Pontiella sulfatireligans]|uniref:23S rRNA (Uridine(2479)-2'-O)-methyltransferase n=1 Tax=Pontiella sulfatireligans TaxID=2750658 RepID=A0A6C2UG49_9BACT|nr:RNA methyltransferase [Pontiella sulfatireligans]VGO18889.1 23S rRNA (uridine(2479)-2'-O)-methyltransferase [Pontiella sulfatireligans]